MGFKQIAENADEGFCLPAGAAAVGDPLIRQAALIADTQAGG